MQNPIVRAIVAVVAGVVAAFVVVALLERLGHMVFPPPPGLDPMKPEDQAKLMSVIPLGAKIAVVVAWFFGSLTGAKRTPTAPWENSCAAFAAAARAKVVFPAPPGPTKEMSRWSVSIVASEESWSSRPMSGLVASVSAPGAPATPSPR